MQSHDREQFEVFAYSNSRDDDATTEQFKRVTAWRLIEGMSDEAVAQQIRDDRIDILVDLTGHIGGNRMCVFARKPARPVQVTYLGYQNTTGMTAMDYRLTDAHADPPGTTDECYTEKLVRLPGSFFCYRPPERRPAGGERTAGTRLGGRVTLGWLNFLAKTTPEAIQMCSRLLVAVPNAQLIMLAYRPGVFEDRVLDAMAQRGSTRRGSRSSTGGHRRSICGFTTGSILRWIHSPSMATPRFATRCGWACPRSCGRARRMPRVSVERRY